MRTSRRHWLVGGTILAIAGAAWWLRPDPTEVQVSTVAPGVLRVTIDEPGLTRLPQHAQVNAPTSGRVAEARVTVGDSVGAGDPVAVLAPAPLDPRMLEEARASARAATAAREEAEARVRQVTTTWEEARRQRERVARLVEAGGAAPRELEAATDAEAIAGREVDAARARVRAARADERRAQVAARSDASPSGAALVIRSPIAGRVLRIFEDHERVVPAGTPLLEVGDPSRLEVVVEVLSRDAVGLAPGMAVLYRLPAGDTARGRVERVEPAAFTRISPLGISEQRVRVITRPVGPLPGVGDAYELPTALVVWEGREVLAAPASALVPVGDGWGVFVLRDGRTHRVGVTLGHRGTQAVEVVSGLAAGDRVVRLPDERVADGGRARERR